MVCVGHLYICSELKSCTNNETVVLFLYSTCILEKKKSCKCVKWAIFSRCEEKLGVPTMGQSSAETSCKMLYLVCYFISDSIPLPMQLYNIYMHSFYCFQHHEIMCHVACYWSYNDVRVRIKRYKVKGDIYSSVASDQNLINETVKSRNDCMYGPSNCWRVL